MYVFTCVTHSSMHRQVYVLGECGELSWVRELPCVHARVYSQGLFLALRMG